MEWVPHGYCLLWQKWLIVLYAIDNVLIFGAYLAISIVIYLALQHVETQISAQSGGQLPRQTVIVARLFGAFIMSCGIGHLLDAVLLWVPLYGIDAAIKTLTAIVSVLTALYFPSVIHHTIDVVFKAEDVRLELLRVNQLLHLFLERGPFCAYIKNEQSQMTWYNEEICRRFGIQKETWLGQSDVDFLEDKEAGASILANDRLVLEGGTPQAFIEAAGTPTGACEWVSSKFAFSDPITGEKLLGGISLDITQSRMAQKVLGETVTQLEETNAQLKRRKNDIVTISDLATTLLTCDEYREAQEVVGVCAKRLFRETSGSIFMISNSRDGVNEVFSWGDRLTSSATFNLKDCWAIKRNALNEITDGDGYLCSHITHQEGSHLCVPLLGYGIEDPRIGILYLHSHTPISEGEKDIAEIVGRLLAISISNMQLKLRLREESIKDPLTGIFNRRYMEETLQREFAKAGRESTKITLIMLDLDHFGNWNKRHGVQIGDLVLREVGAILNRFARRGDIVCRYGGEELLSILLGASLEKGMERAEMIRQQIESLVITHKEKVLGTVTGSFGVACYPVHGETIESVIDAADAALRQAKQAGRNQVCVADERTIDDAAPGDFGCSDRDGD